MLTNSGEADKVKKQRKGFNELFYRNIFGYTVWLLIASLRVKHHFID